MKLLLLLFDDGEDVEGEGDVREGEGDTTEELGVVVVANRERAEYVPLFV